ncbi:MAG: hypothetical protein J5562_06285, partial [Clostridia bacterium]|nr:hypothetical protein [Clostridia bacterium]
RTINNREADDRVIENFRKMLVTLGVYTESEDGGNDGLTNALKGLNDFNVRVFGYKGFVDILKK